MEHKRIKILLEKFSRNDCTSEELEELKHHFSDSSSELIVRNQLLRELYQFNENEDAEEAPDYNRLFDSVNQEIDLHEKDISWMNPKKNKKRRISQLIKFAAVFLIMFSAGSFLTYFMVNSPEENLVAYHEIRVPLGSRSQLVLPDSTEVWLNAGSTIRYPDGFNNTNRNIILEGEAYFEVAKNEELPFIVNTGDLNIVAIGTAFNVKSYHDEGIIETTLIEGKVSIHNYRQKDHTKEDKIYLKPSEKAVYIKDQQKLRVEEIEHLKASNPEIGKPEAGDVYIASKVDPLPIISWKDNKLILKSEELSSLAIKLERKYNVNIQFSSEKIKKFRFTGTLEDETLTQVLDVIKLTSPIDYKLSGKEVIIFENTRMTPQFKHYLKTEN